MSLSAQDETQIINWFEEKQKADPTSDAYFAYRDLIFGHVLKRLSDYFGVLKSEWKVKHQLSDEECISIIHDGLLAAVENFKLHFKSRSGVKFITYLTRILRNLALSYARKNHIQYSGKGLSKKQRNMGKIPSSVYVSLDAIVSNLEHGRLLDSGEEDRSGTRFVAPLMKVLEQNEEVITSQSTYKLVAENLLERLSGKDKFVLQSILEGRHLSDIAKDLGVTTPGVKYRLKRLSKKFVDLKQELWASEKQS